MANWQARKPTMTVVPQNPKPAWLATGKEGTQCGKGCQEVAGTRKAVWSEGSCLAGSGSQEDCPRAAKHMEATGLWRLPGRQPHVGRPLPWERGPEGSHVREGHWAAKAAKRAARAGMPHEQCPIHEKTCNSIISADVVHSVWVLQD